MQIFFCHRHRLSEQLTSAAVFSLNPLSWACIPVLYPLFKTKALSLARYYYWILQIKCDLFINLFILHFIVLWLLFRPKTIVPAVPGSTGHQHALLGEQKTLCDNTLCFCLDLWSHSLLNIKPYIFSVARGEVLAQGAARQWLTNCAVVVTL